MRKFKNKTLPRGILIQRGYVWIRIFPSGKRYLKCIGPLSTPGILQDAQHKLEEIRREIRLGKFGLEDEPIRITMVQALDLYWEHHAKDAPSSQSFKSIINNLKSFFRGRYVDEITFEDVREYRKHRARQLWKGNAIRQSTINRDHTILTHLFNLLKDLKRIRKIKNIRLPLENPGSLVSKADEKEFRRKRILSIEEFRRFMAVATPRVRRIVLGAINTTLRMKTLKALTLDNVNSATNQLEGMQSKTGKPFVIPVSGPIQKIIDTTEGKYIFDFTNFRREFQSAIEDAKLIDFNFLDLRRTGARMMLAKGMDLATVSKYLGHTTLTMTDSYVQPAMKDLQIAGEVLGSVFNYDIDPSCSKNCSQDQKSTTEKIDQNATV